MASLRELVKKSKSENVPRFVEYDRNYGVSFKMLFLPKSELQRLIGKHTKIDFDPRTHVKEEKIEQKNLTSEMAKTCIVGWKGITYEWLMTQIPLTLPEGVNPKDEVEFSEENLEVLLEEAYNFDNWVFETVRNASNFSAKVEEELKN